MRGTWHARDMSLPAQRSSHYCPTGFPRAWFTPPMSYTLLMLSACSAPIARHPMIVHVILMHYPYKLQCYGRIPAANQIVAAYLAPPPSSKSLIVDAGKRLSVPARVGSYTSDVKVRGGLTLDPRKRLSHGPRFHLRLLWL